LAQARRVLC